MTLTVTPHQTHTHETHHARQAQRTDAAQRSLSAAGLVDLGPLRRAEPSPTDLRRESPHDRGERARRRIRFGRIDPRPSLLDRLLRRQGS